MDEVIENLPNLDDILDEYNEGKETKDQISASDTQPYETI